LHKTVLDKNQLYHKDSNENQQIIHTKNSCVLQPTV